MNSLGRTRAGTALGVVGLLVVGAGWAEAGLFSRRQAARNARAPVAAQAAVPVPAPAPVPVPARVPATALVHTSYEPSPYPMLGTFYPSPWIMVRGNFPAGGGYSPLGEFGDASMDVYGPLSPLRGYTAPVVTYERGYNGQVIPREGHSFSTPNRPESTPVVYPTQANYFYRIKETGDPPWWANGMDWIDQN